MKGKAPKPKPELQQSERCFLYAEMQKKSKKKKSSTFALITLLKNFEAAHDWVGIKMVAITLISLLKDQGHNNSNYLQFPIPAIILL